MARSRPDDGVETPYTVPRRFRIPALRERRAVGGVTVANETGTARPPR